MLLSPLRLILLLIVLIPIAVMSMLFAQDNQQAVVLKLLELRSFELPMYWWLYLSLLAGFALGVAVMALRNLSLAWQLRRARKQVRAASPDSGGVGGAGGAGASTSPRGATGGATLAQA